jgi:hypothetical protein
MEILKVAPFTMLDLQFYQFYIAKEILLPIDFLHTGSINLCLHPDFFTLQTDVLNLEKRATCSPSYL